MKATSMRKKDVRAILDAARRQGCRLVETRNGVLIRHHDRVSTVMLHWSTSDWRALANTRAEFRRLGLAWPFDDRRATRRKNAS